MEFDAVVLAGGSARRLGGADKASLELGGRSLLDRALDAVAEAGQVIVVGPRRSTAGDVIWTQESPAGAGPLAAAAAGLEHVGAETFVLVAVDYPFVDAGVIASLLDAFGEHDGAALSDDVGRLHFVVGAYRAGSVRTGLRRLGEIENASMHRVFSELDVIGMHNDRAALDIDNPEDLEAAREREAKHD